MAPGELHSLLSVLDERGIALGHSDVAWAFESPKTADDVTAWVEEYLSSPSLLMKEELHLYVRL